MSKIIVLLTVAFLASISNAAIDPTPKEVQVGINGVFVPGGFDSTTDAYVVVSGIFQNGCYKWNRAERTSRDPFTHEIKSIASVTPGMCIMVMIPFQKEVRLGQLNAGEHTLRFLNGDGTFIEKKLTVEQ